MWMDLQEHAGKALAEVQRSAEKSGMQHNMHSRLHGGQPAEQDKKTGAERDMIDHISTYATGYAATRAFYEAAFAPLGCTVQTEFVAQWNADFPTQRMCAFGADGKPVFWIIEVRQPATPRHVAFCATDRAAVDTFYTAALANGGQDNGAPGLRPMYHEHYYGAFVIDPDGNNVEAVCHLPERSSGV